MKTKVELFDRAIVAYVLDAPELRANFARQQLREAQDQNRQALGAVPDHITFVDGARSEAIERVRPDGSVIFEFDIGTGVVEWIHAALTQASPVKTGKYKASHAIYADGVEVDNPKAAENSEEVVILSLVPYARKIERRGTRPAPKTKRQARGLYQTIAVMAARRFGSLARVTFTYMTPMGGASALANWAQSNASRREGSRKQQAQLQKNMRQPAIYIRFR
jgi:hypothetical protein